ncbi:uncharacterized protein LOC142974015 [Anticarsia gemmatalis]|uniref:uncharacterized protein LOC142974015 n=1 Tax=Anticarsia gemmatalis TaxID=129554 RepID=UPI003F758A00
MPTLEAPCVELGSAPQTPSITASPSPSDLSSASSPEPPNIRATPLFRVLAMPPPDPEQPPGQEELERRLPGYRRIVIPRELTLIELLKQSSGVTSDEEVLTIREAKLRVVAERIGLRRLHVLAPRLRKLTLDGSAIASLRDLGIGLVHLKILSISRCNLTSLDGVWGLGALRELYAAGNRIQDLQPLAALQKLHTLDLSDNPIADSSRLWTIGICGALRKLTLSGTPASNEFDYRFRVASALPMLVYLDERPLHTDIDYDSDGVFGAASSSSDSEEEIDKDLIPKVVESSGDAEPGPSTSSHDQMPEACPEGDHEFQEPTRRRRFLRRPATTENAGVRPARPNLPARPRTAQDRPVIDEPTRLQILNTLMDDEWLCSGSKLTSLDAVCGNLARALRRTSSAYRRYHKDAETELVEQTMEDASRAVAAEIPRAPRLEDWIKFKEETGIEISIDENERPQCPDSSKILDRLEQIERETRQRFEEEGLEGTSSGYMALPNSAFVSTTAKTDFELWSNPGSDQAHSVTDINTFFEEVGEMHTLNRDMFRFPSNNSSRPQ